MDNQKQIHLFQEAIAFHQSGALDEAERRYKVLLTSLPADTTLFNMLGLIAIQQGRFEEGIRFLLKSLAINPCQADVLNNIGNAYKALNHLDLALVYFEQAIAINPCHADSHYNRGVVLHCLTRWDEAITCYDRAIAIDPDNADAHYNKGVTLQAISRMEEALASYDRAIGIDSGYEPAYINRGLLLHDLNQFAVALANYEQAIAINPVNGDTYFNRGNVLRELNRLDEALASYRQAFTLNPNDAEAHSNAGNLLIDLNRYEEALLSCDRAIASNPAHSGALYNRGIILARLKRHEEACMSYRDALAVMPDFVDAHINLGVTLQKMQLLEEALACYEHALAIDADSESAYFNRAVVLQQFNRVDDALDSYQQALARNPEHIDANWGKAMLKLLMGDYLEGWQLYEWRWRKNPSIRKARNYQQPLWLGEQSLQGKSLYIYREQGLGDFIQFSRYIVLAEQLGATVVLETPGSLLSMMATLTQRAVLIEMGQPVPVFDYHCPIMSLPLAFKTTLATIPDRVPYLTVDRSKTVEWRRRLGESAQLKVGLVWSGSKEHSSDHHRSFNAKTLLPLLQIPFVEFHCLQTEIREDDAAFIADIANLKIHHSNIDDFGDTAALIEIMDVVISVDTSVAHLAGALAKKAWILLPYAPDYRWMLDRNDTPWYPTARLFRQPAIGDWDSVIFEVQNHLCAAFPELSQREHTEF